MMIEFVTGDFFDFDADVRINTVNCVGVMGAGVALAFKKKYPEMFKDYAKQCKEGKVTPGKPSVWQSGDMFSKGITIINFPTKNHWRKPSKYEYIEDGLIWLSNYLDKQGNLTITLPALGCGHGGLDWSKVKGMITNHLSDCSQRILVFEPASSINAGKKPPQSDVDSQVLSDLGVEIVEVNSPLFPIRLKGFTEKPLYIYGNKAIEHGYDVSVMSSSKPNDTEKKAVFDLVEHCKRAKLSILFGGAAFDKKIALEAAQAGLKVGVFLPTAILNSAQKIVEYEDVASLTLLSIGDPSKSFDRKAYMPAVLCRIFLSEAVIFTTDKLEWLSRQRKFLDKAVFRGFHINYQELSEKDNSAVQYFQSTPVEIVNNIVNWDQI